MRSRLAALAAALALTTAGTAAEPVLPGTAGTPQISFEVRVLTVPDLFLERIGIDFDFGAPGGMPREVRVTALPEGPILTDPHLHVLLDAIQGDRRSDVMMAPKVTTDDGQSAAIQCLQRQLFTTGVDAVRVNGQTVLVPRNTAVDVGVSMNLNGQVAADRKSVLTSLRFTATEIGSVDMIPVLTQAMAATPDGKNARSGKPVPFTQYIQSPRIDTTTIEKRNLTIPNGGHAVLVGPARTCEMRQEFGPSVLSKIPYVNRLYKNVGVGRETVRTVLIVTTRVLEAK